MGATQRAEPALRADVRIPDRNVLGDAAFFVLRRAGGEGAVAGHGADGQIVAAIGDHHAQHVLDERRGVGRNRRHHLHLRGRLLRIFHFMQGGQCGINRRVVLLDDLFAALLPVGLLDRVLDPCDRVVGGNHAGQLEEAGLHDRVDADAHLRLASHVVGVDRVELQLLVDDLPLHFDRQMIPDLIERIGAVQEERRPRLGHR